MTGMTGMTGSSVKCATCQHVLKLGATEYVVRIGRDRKRPAMYFGPYGLACSLECAQKKDPVGWSEVTLVDGVLAGYLDQYG